MAKIPLGQNKGKYATFCQRYITLEISYLINTFSSPMFPLCLPDSTATRLKEERINVAAFLPLYFGVV